MKRRVLIVEDEVIVADDLQWKLQQIGHEIIGTAISGPEALSLATQHRPDVVIMDIQLQGAMNGIEAAQRIQEECGAAVIFVTAFAAMFARQPRTMLPSTGCLSKPFSTVELKTALESTIAYGPKTE